VSETLQLEEAVEVHDAPKLLVEWSSPWRDFVGSIGPALARSERRLAGEAPFGLIPLRIMLPSYFLEALFIFAAIAIQIKVAQLRPFVAPRFSRHDVVYYSGDELPRTQDLGGASAGTTGRAGGDEAHHATQTIKIARGGSLVPKVVDAPNLKLPSTRDAVANLLAIKPDPGPPPVEGLRSMRTAPNLATTLVAPAPNVIRDYTRNGVQLDSVIAPAPSITRDRPLTTPTLNTTLIAPAPNISGPHTLVAPVLVPAVIPPAPSVARDRASVAPTLNPSVVAPAPSISRDQPRDQARSNPALAANVIPPAPGGVSREISRPPVQMTNPAVIPPPVSAPEHAPTRNSKLSLPAPAVIAPPPSADIAQDMRRPASGSIPDSSKTVVPPPPTQSASGSFMSSLIGKIFGPSEVVPPPPAVPPSRSRDAAGTSLSANVVAPPPAVSSSGSRNGMSPAPAPSVVAPPPSTTVSSNTSSRILAASATALGPPTVVPPPPSLSGPGGGTGKTAGGAGVPAGTLLANNVVPPPPSLSGGAGASGSGRKGSGLGAPLDAGAPPAPPTTAGSGANAGAVISSQPGPKIGLPSNGANGSLAMSPSGGEKPGLGGAGAGASIGRGTSAGSGLNGTGPGAGRTDAGHGSDPNSRSGISPTAGPGGAGSAPSGSPAVPGVDISGGNTVVNLPSFGSDPSGSEVVAPGHTPPIKHSKTLDVTIVATASSGGAFEPYQKLLQGQTYTAYFDTSVGQVVMEFSEAVPSNQPGGITAPQSIRTELPSGLPHGRIVISCTIDTAGNLKALRVREAGPADMTAKVMDALRSWKFQPAMRGDLPVEITAILGFGIDTSDRN
jgi:Gram-negative bacterial TonB protein C-terminal